MIGRLKYEPSFSAHVESCEEIFQAAIRDTVENRKGGTPFTPATRARHLAGLNANLIFQHIKYNQGMGEADKQRAWQTIDNLLELAL